MAKNDSDREIAELLASLKEQTEQNKPSPPEKATKKAKEMTDDDVKAMLRRYYSDVDTLPQEKEPAFEFDTSDFAEEEPQEEETAALIEEPIVEEPVIEEPVIEEPIVEEPVIEEPVIEEPVIEEPVVEEPVIEEPVIEEPVIEEPVVEEPVIEEPVIEEPIVEETVTDEPEAPVEYEADEEIEADEGGLDEIIYENPNIDETSSHFELEEDVEPPAFLEEETEEAEDLPVLPDEDDMREWHPTADVSGRDDDGELDLMVALGLGDRLIEKYGDERVRRAEEKLRLREAKERLEVNAHGYAGAELTPRSDRAKIEKRYSNQQIRVTLRLIGIILLSAALLFFENLRLFGISPSLFGTVSIRTLILMSLLIGCAALSYRRLAEAVLFAIGRRQRGNVLLPFSLLIMLAYDLTIIIFAPKSELALFNFPVALGFLFETLSELFDLIRERRTFKFLCQDGDGGLCGLLIAGGEERDRDVFSADEIEFVEGYFRRSSDNRHSYPTQMFFTVLPLAAAGALLVILSTVARIPTIRAVSTFPAIFAFAAPLSGVFCRSWQRLRASMSLEDRGSAVIGGAAANEYMDVKAIVFGDDLAFHGSGVTIKNIKIYDNCEIYHTIYNINALFEKAGGPLKTLMHDTAANLGEPRSVRMIAAADHYVEALVDKKNTVCAGSFTALEARGVDIIKDPHDSRDCEDGCVMYAAINGVACARFHLKYKLDASFRKTYHLLAREGIGTRIRTLDPNIDRALLVSMFGESADVGIRREPERASSGENAAATSIVSRSGKLSLALALVTARRVRRAERAMTVVAVLQLIMGVAAASLAVFLGVPSYMMSCCAAIMQLIWVLPAAVIYSLNVKR